MSRRGFTLIELLIVLAIVGILVGLGAPNYLRWRATSATNEAAQQFARDIERQRTEAKRVNLDRSIRVPLTASRTYELVAGNLSAGTARTVTLPPGTQVVPLSATTAGTQFTFSPPYGTVNIPLRSYEIQWIGNPDIKRTVRVVSVTGKVIVQ